MTPLHPVLPALIEVYVNSILVPPSSKLYDQANTNQPLSEDEIRRVFQNSVFGSQFDNKTSIKNVCGYLKRWQTISPQKKKIFKNLNILKLFIYINLNIFVVVAEFNSSRK